MAFIYSFGLLCSTAVYELINKDRNNIDELSENLLMYILHGIKPKNQVSYSLIFFFLDLYIS